MTDDRGWGRPAGAASERAASRAQERIAAAEARTAERQAQREAGQREREAARAARRAEEDQRRAARLEERSEERDARPRRRASGALARTGEERVVRDTRHYATNVDHGRIIELARRGATVPGLASVFGLPEEEITRILAAG
ncbi:hypothetical protein COA17_04980 [Sphingomonas ginsenosidimutans]|uniref:Uncharacterized protein n=2 Tax=Sphingomonas ginsenosidimutans TaxID=862134 RepID=A0A2A4I0U2_9SPHN|nr:hypothetical protein [Sphingomonas ginsenosidimutans]PCG10732.1 hypothetical protein COA17_04980 [Sphingomonas ginsenosidimutans]